MQRVETKNKKGKKLPSKKKVREDFDKVVAHFEKEFELYAPPYQRKLFIYLFAKLEGREPPTEIAELLKSNEYFKEDIEYDENKFNQLVGKAPKDVQECIIAALIERLEPKEKEYEEEMARDEAADELLNCIGELPYTEQTSIYKGLLEQVKNREAIAVPV